MKRNIPIFKYDDAWQILARGDRLNGLVIDAGSEEVMLRIEETMSRLKIYGFAGLHRHNGKGGMTAGRRGYIDSIHIRVVNQLLGIGIPFRYAVTLSIATRLLLLTTHHRHDRRALYFRECRTTFLFCYLTTADEAPP